jgi:peptide chain release factor 2
VREKSEIPGFWDRPQEAAALMQELDALKKEAADFRALGTSLTEAREWIGLGTLSADEIKEVTRSLAAAEKTLRTWEFQLLLGGAYAESDALLTLRSGAGGTEAQDWAEMLLRMYLRYAERQGYATAILDEARGQEAGIKSVTVEIRGRYAYGYLVRLSPFNAHNLRQTSFASVEVLPVLPETDKSIEIRDEDITVDTFRASGAGGQHVNKTESAVRITHVPSGIVVSCQSERSQLQNRVQAMKILRSKLLQERLVAEAEERAKLRGDQQTAAFGSQIRSYVLHPYTLVKDHRTETETSATESVLNGDLDSFIQSELQYLYQKEK